MSELTLSPDAIGSIRDARRDAETELKNAISARPDSDKVDTYLPAFTRFATSQFDAYAGELLYSYRDESAFKRVLEEEVAASIKSHPQSLKAYCRIKA